MQLKPKEPTDACMSSSRDSSEGFMRVNPSVMTHHQWCTVHERNP
jgi:hypothetical protein